MLMKPNHEGVLHIMTDYEIWEETDSANRVKVLFNKMCHLAWGKKKNKTMRAFLKLKDGVMATPK